jgi:hypothetical protein
LGGGIRSEYGFFADLGSALKKPPFSQKEYQSTSDCLWPLILSIANDYKEIQDQLQSAPFLNKAESKGQLSSQEKNLSFW